MLFLWTTCCIWLLSAPRESLVGRGARLRAAGPRVPREGGFGAGRLRLPVQGWWPDHETALAVGRVVMLS